LQPGQYLSRAARRAVPPGRHTHTLGSTQWYWRRRPANMAHSLAPAAIRGCTGTITSGTHCQERFTADMRRRERVVRFFPTGASVTRLQGARLIEQADQGSPGQCSLAMAAYWQWRTRQDDGHHLGRPEDTVVCSVAYNSGISGPHTTGDRPSRRGAWR